VFEADEPEPELDWAFALDGATVADDPLVEDPGPMGIPPPNSPGTKLLKLLVPEIPEECCYYVVLKRF
jgi:hypothetical protein